MPNCRSFRGVGSLLGAVSGIFYALCGTFGKLLNGNVSPIMIAWCNNVSIIICAVVILLITRTHPWSYGLRDCIICSCLGVLNALFLIMQFKAFQMIDLADAITLASLSPLFIILIECKNFKFMDCFVVFLCIVGVLLCAQPDVIFKTGKSLTTTQMTGFALAIGVALTWALFFMTIEELKHMDIGSMLLVNNLTSFVITSAIAAFYEEFHKAVFETQLLYLSLLCISNFVALIVSHISVILDNSLYASIGRTTDIAISLVFDCVIFHAHVDTVSVFGSLVIMTGIIIPAAASLYQNRANLERYEPV